MKVTIKQGDLSKEVCDAIVNPTNNSMKPNGGLDTILHKHMGDFFSSQVNAMTAELGDEACPVGSSRIFISRAQRDPTVARFVINTVGPHYVKEGKDLASFHLQSCYGTSLALANAYGLTSIAYPAISCGAYRFPANEAAQVGIETIRQNSYQVVDVRFVLFERHIYEAFIQEWNAYAEKINVEANATNDKEQSQGQPSSTTPAIVPKPTIASTPSARFCLLCKEKELSRDQEQLCGDCTALPRADVFNKFLHRLRSAGEKSFQVLDSECQLLHPLLSLYPLNYIPAQVFDQKLHVRDQIAEGYLQSYCDRKFRTNAMPMAILGDGNCFYNTFVKLASAGTTTEVNTITPQELRARNVIELILNKRSYMRKYHSFEPVLDPFESYVRQEMVHDTNYVCPWDLLSIATVLNIKVLSIYPRVNGSEDLYYTTINDKILEPLDITQTTPLPEVRLLFSHMLKQVRNKEKAWTPNHFVPILNLR